MIGWKISVANLSARKQCSVKFTLKIFIISDLEFYYHMNKISLSSLAVEMNFDGRFKEKFGEDSWNAVRRIAAHATNMYTWSSLATTLNWQISNVYEVPESGITASSDWLWVFYPFIFSSTSVTRLGDFYSCWWQNILTKVAQIFSDFEGYFKIQYFLSKNCCAYFLEIFFATF